MPVHYTLFFLLLITSVCLGEDLPAPTSADHYARISIAGNQANSGVFDPSVEYAPDGTGWLAYSSVTMPRFVETRIAKSTNQGKTWQYVAKVNPSFEHSLSLPNGKSLNGVWRFEVPALVYDAKDVPARRWKLLSHQYFTLPPYKRDDRRFDIGWISLRTASAPTGPWSASICLFGDKPKCRTNPNTLDPGLRGMKMYSEPGMMVFQDTLYVSLDASVTVSGLGKWQQRKVILLASDDHGHHWRYVNTLSDGKDAARLGYHALTGSSLMMIRDQAYLLISPSGRKKLFAHNRGHDGAFLLRFQDIKQGLLERDDAQQLVVRQWLPVTHKSGGLADYDPRNKEGGVIFAQINLSEKRPDAEFFQIFNTHIHPK